MHKLTVAALAAAALVGTGALTLAPLASAQTAANPPVPPAPAMPMPGMMHGEGHGPGPRGWMQRPGQEGWMHGRMMRHEAFERLKTWGLFHRPADLALTPDDVKIIAEAILLRHGQHDWKVGDVTQNADNTVSFAFVTAHGDAIAHFSINTKTGRISRT
ncbi:MAG: hypothetical protein ACREFP_21775, partial [Acetobacteraceae bacterium]